MTDILSGGDLDGDFYFVSWDEDLIKNIDNQNTSFYYPKKDVIKNSPTKEFSRNHLVEHFVKSIIFNEIGLLHYKLILLYDENKENMKKSKYNNYIIEINKAIDGLPSQKVDSDFNAHKMKWYIIFWNFDFSNQFSKAKVNVSGTVY